MQRKKNQRPLQRRQSLPQRHTSQERPALSADREWASTQTATHAESADTQSLRARQRLITLAQKSKNSSGLAGHIIYSALLLIVLSIFSIFYLYSSGVLDQNSANFLLTSGISLFFPFFGMSYMLNKGIKPGEILSRLGLSKNSLSVKIIGVGLVIFFALFTLELLVNVLSNVIGTTIDTNVGMLLGSAPVWFYIFSAVIAPINEEIFFRGFLVPRIGIVISAIIFGLLHASYNSTFGIEIIAAIIFGLVAGYVFKKTNSLYPSMIAHILINTLAVLALGAF